jgi:AraC-like DNA-binding protein
MAAFRGIHWRSQRDIQISAEGRHVIDLPETFPLSIMPLAFTPGYRNTPNFHEYLEISWIERGTGSFSIGQKKYPVESGDIFLNGNVEFHVLESDYTDLLRVISLYFLPELIYRPGGNMTDFEYLKPFYDHSIEFSHRIVHGAPLIAQIVDLIERIQASIAGRPEHYELEAKNALCEILLLLVRHYGQFAVNERRYQERRRNLDRLQNVFQHLQEAYQDKITLSHLANIACMSESYLCRFFKQTTNFTLKEYLQRVRIDRAKELLIAGKLPITQVGLEVGFESHSYFDRIFRRLNGISPREFCDRFGTKAPSEGFRIAKAR